ncbi:MAG: DUF2505 domain-containing protein [Gammaproteobacteria bacterium]|jgi:hypothetical protein|nr:DUF2505 domain-containing protein [Gammaproteobacteria bacterium]
MVEFEFDCAVEEVFGLLTDPDFVVERSLALGDLESSCKVQERGEVTVVVSDRKVRRDIPSFLARIFDPVQTIRMTETWRPNDDDSGWVCRQEVEIRGQPISVNADIELFATGDGCCYQLEQRARAKIPLIGARVEKFAVSQALEGCRAEMDYLEQALG